MKYQHFILNLFALISILLFTACSSVTSNVHDATQKSLIKVDETNLKFKSGYESKKHKIKKSYVNISNSIGELSTNFLENSFIQFFMTDTMVLKNRETLIIWKDGTSKDSKALIKHYGKRYLKKTIDTNTLDLSQQFNYLTKYYLLKEQKSYKERFLEKFPKPRVDQFKTDRQNVQAVNEYKFQLQLAEQRWELQTDQTKKIVASKVLGALYGKPSIKKISYDPESEKLFVNIISKRNSFAQNVFFNIESDKAKKIVSNKHRLKPILYFRFDNDSSVELVGVSFQYLQHNYLAKITDTMFQKNTNFKITHEKLDLSSINVDYKIVAKDVEPPSWFYHLKNEAIIGYGMGDTQEEAKNFALKEIAQQLSVTVNAKTSVSKEKSTSSYEKNITQNINLETKDLELKGAKTIKAQKKNGIWFVAVEK
jgi:hypothetical protein